jgi:hypothetical protein
LHSQLFLLFWSWRGSRVAWSFVTVSGAIGLLSLPLFVASWWSIVLNVVTLVCLLAPSSRRFVWRRHSAEASRPAGPTTWDADRYPDSDRPAGWYVDPHFPGRMRYWGAGGARWSGTAKTPRKIRQAWDAPE